MTGIPVWSGNSHSHVQSLPSALCKFTLSFKMWYDLLLSEHEVPPLSLPFGFGVDEDQLSLRAPLPLPLLSVAQQRGVIEAMQEKLS